MQEEIEHKTVNLAISTTKLSARTLLRGMQSVSYTHLSGFQLMKPHKAPFELCFLAPC